MKIGSEDMNKKEILEEKIKILEEKIEVIKIDEEVENTCDFEEDEKLMKK